MNKFIFLPLVIALSSGSLHAQSLLKKLGGKAKETVEKKLEHKTEKKTAETMDKVLDGHHEEDGKKATENVENTTDKNVNTDKAEKPAQTPQQGTKAAEMAYAKSDFVPGDEIIFEDTFENEKLGEFPSQWDLLSGSSEVVLANGKKGMELTRYGNSVFPLMKNPKNFLGDVFTIEYDFMSVKTENFNSLWPTIHFHKANGSVSDSIMSFSKAGQLGEDERFNYRWKSPSNEHNNGGGEVKMEYGTWHHVAISFNKRAWKVYVNGVRIINVPNVSEPPGWFLLSLDNVGEGSYLYSNFRIAKGAVPLYDRLMSDGKIITYGITFDVGKSTIKPESLTEINRIATLMKENPDLKFSVEGHTDSTGTAANNQTLSEARSKAVMDKLVEIGIAASRLKSAGKGQTSPIAENSTDEGRAKNRRVEFVKM